MHLHLLTLLTFAFSFSVRAGINTVEVKLIEGEVVAYTWRTAYSYSRLENAEKGSTVKTTFKLPNHSFIILKNVTGIENETLQQISLSFVNGEPSDRLAALVEIENNLYIRINLAEQPEWNIGDKLVLRNCVISFDEQGSGFSFEEIEIKKADN